MTRYSDWSGGKDGSIFYEYHCDSCGDTIQLGEFEKLPDGWLQLGAKYKTSRHLCRSCRYAGAVDKDTMTELKTIKEQLKQTGSTASKILTYTDATAESKRTARLVIADAELCVSKLNRVLITLALEGVGA